MFYLFGGNVAALRFSHLSHDLPSCVPTAIGPLFILQSQPLFELRCSNNVVHLHTCADSCAALVNLLQYLVSQGDLHPPPRHTSPTEIAGQKLPVRLVKCGVYDVYFKDVIKWSNIPMLLCFISCQKVQRLCCPVLPLKPPRSTSTTWLTP